MRFTNLDMDALRSFALGIETNSFARAADRLGRSTSAVSAHLRKLEEQAGVPLVRRSGRGLGLTDAGEALLSYARRLLDLNDAAMNAVKGAELAGWVRLGLQEDFGEVILPRVLGRFARSHPRVKIEGRIARNSELMERVALGQLDLALVWDDGPVEGEAETLARLPLCWLGSAQEDSIWQSDPGGPLPLVVFEAPCLLRTLACGHLDRMGLAWRIAFVSPSVGGLWAATAAGLGVALRTPVGRPPTVRCIAAETIGLPNLPSLGLSLLKARKDTGPVGEHLAAIIKQAIADALPSEWSS